MDVKVRALANSRVELKEQLIIDKGVDRVIVVLEVEHLVHEGEGEGFIAEMVVDALLVLAYGAGRKVSRVVFALPKLQLQVLHVPLVEIAKELIVLVLKAVELVYAELLNLLLILEVE